MSRPTIHDEGRVHVNCKRNYNAKAESCMRWDSAVQPLLATEIRWECSYTVRLILCNVNMLKVQNVYSFTSKEMLVNLVRLINHYFPSTKYIKNISSSKCLLARELIFNVTICFDLTELVSYLWYLPTFETMESWITSTMRKWVQGSS